MLQLWLLPSLTDTNATLLEDIKRSFGSFHLPHIKIAKINAPLSITIDSLKHFSSKFLAKPITVQIGDLSSGNGYYGGVGLTVKNNDGLQTLLKNVQNHWASTLLKDVDFTPLQIDLFYGEEKNKQSTLNNLRNNPLLEQVKTLTFDSIAIVSTTQNSRNMNNWQILGRCPFGSTNIFRSGIYVNGSWTQSSNPWSRIPVINPATKELIHYLNGGTKDDVNRAVEAAKKAFPIWGNKSAKERADYLKAIANEIESNLQSIAELDTIDNGKPIIEARDDIGDVVKCFRYYAKLAVQKEAEEETKIEGVNDSFECSVRKEPVGVCGLIIPWNYPLLMLAWKIAPCLAAGCTAILKPSEYTSLSALEFADVCNRIGLPPGVVNIVTGYGPDVGEAISSHPDVRKVAFTGSVATGKRVMRMASETIKKCSLELGGKSPIIVLADADIEQAADWITMGIFFNCGQVCSATSRLLVHESIKDKVLQAVVGIARSIKIGNGLDENTKLGPIVNDVQHKRVLEYIHKGIQSGARLAYGGPVDAQDQNLNKGYFVHPTIFDNVSTDMAIWREEIFGPVLSIKTFRTIDEAIALANESNFGLAAAVIGGNEKVCQGIVKRLEAGIVWVNCSQPTFVEMPWGGYKESGTGRELGPWGYENFIEVKQVTKWADKESKGFGWFKSKL